MKYGIREICDVVLKAKGAQKVGNKVFYKGEPVIYFDTLKTSSMEGASTTVYAQGGPGNSRLMAWEGERTVTFTMEDALISPEGFMILTGAGLIEATPDATIKQHITETVDASNVDIIPAGEGEITGYKNGSVEITVSEFDAKKYTDPVTGDEKTISNIAAWTPIKADASEVDVLKIPLEYKPYSEGHTAEGNFMFAMLVKDGEIISEPFIPSHNPDDINPGKDKNEGKWIIEVKAGTWFNALGDDECAEEWCASGYGINAMTATDGSTVGGHDCPYHVSVEEGKALAGLPFDSIIVDYYTEKESDAMQIEITPDKFGGNYYLEASTLFRDTNGVDLPAEFIIPNCKIQSNFNFSMASTGDPSTFTFTMDAFPDYTRFDHSKKVLAAIQIIKGAGAKTDLHRHSTAHEAAHDKFFK